MSNVPVEATNMLPILKKKLAFLSGKTHSHKHVKIILSV